MAKKKKAASSRKFNRWKKAVQQNRQAQNADASKDEMLQQALSLLQSGHPDKARLLLEDLLETPDGSPTFLNQLGILAHMLGESETALELLKKSTDLQPTAPFFNNLGLVLEQGNRLDEAEASYQEAIRLNEAFAPAHFNLGNVLQKTSRYTDAVTAYREAVHCNSDYETAYLNMAIALRELDDLNGAEDACLHALRLNPDNVQTVNTWCDIILKEERYENLLSVVDEKFQFLANKGMIYATLGDTLADIGKKEDALKAYRKALEQSGKREKIFFQMARWKKFLPGEADLLELQEEYTNGQPSADRPYLCFALGKALEDTGEYAKAFRYIEEGNRLIRSTYTYTTQEENLFFRKLRTVFDPDFLSYANKFGHRDKSPIFIVGMPRSGTTLIEQILASHSMVFGAGELPQLDQIIGETLHKEGIRDIPEGIRNMDLEKFGDIGRRYTAFTKQLATGATRIVDKMPHNFIWLGLIRLALPEAKIIHCRRDPMDTCWSIYKNIFEVPHKYAQDLTELGNYYRMYQELMDYWKSVIPQAIYEIEYEQLIRDQENETRQLLDYCGLPWEEGCLRFHEAKRRIQTSSMAQVRTPLYTNSIKKWQHFKNELRLLIEIIERKSDS